MSGLSDLPRAVASDGDVRPAAADSMVPLGIGPLDQRIDGFEEGGVFLVVAPPGAAKLVAGLQFLYAGVDAGQPVLALSDSAPQELLGVARAWGLPFDDAWREGLLALGGFRDDFEMRARRAVDPENVVAELTSLVAPGVTRVIVDPGSLFLDTGGKTPLAAAFLRWAAEHPATVCVTYSIDGAVGGAWPSRADWLIGATTGILTLDPKTDALYDARLHRAMPRPGDVDEPVTLELKPGTGFVAPGSLPARRKVDRPGIDPGRLLVVSLGGAHSADLETWARSVFSTEVTSEPFEAVGALQADDSFGGVLIHAPRSRVQEAVKACRALRPLTRAAILVASDDPIRAADRIAILDSGADDCLSGGLNFSEVGVRLRQAISRGVQPHPDGSDWPAGDRPDVGTGADADLGGRVERDVFARELERRAAEPGQSFFCVLDLSASDLAESGVSTEELVDAVEAEIRQEEGDLVLVEPERVLVLLQGARAAHGHPVLHRLRSRLGRDRGGQEPVLRATVLSHPAEAGLVRALLEGNGDG